MKYLKPIALIVLVIAAAVVLYVIMTQEIKADYVVEEGVLLSCETNATSLSVPSFIEGQKITKIGNRAFSNNSSLLNVKLPDGVTHIMKEAFFNCDKLREIDLSETVGFIEPEAFLNCPDLTKINVHFDNQILGSFNGVLFNSSYTYLKYFPTGYERVEFYVPTGTMIIEEKAFAHCLLENVFLPDTVIRIDNYAFEDCRNMKSITLPPRLNSLGQGAFIKCNKLTSITISDGVEIMDNVVGNDSFKQQYLTYGAGTYIKVSNDKWEFYKKAE